VSYYATIPGAKSAEFTESGLGTLFAVTTTPSPGLRSIQEDLQRMGLLAAGTGPTGADGLWGRITAAALEQARVRLGRSAPAYTTSNAGHIITIADDFIAALHAAAAPGAILATLPPSPTSSVTTVDPATSLSPTAIPPPVEEGMSRTQMYLVGGSLAAIGTVAAFYFFWPKSTRNGRVRRNRRRRR
jgi:hypothetical protein